MIYKDWEKSFIFVRWILTMMIVVDSTQVFLHQFSDKASRRDKNISSVIYWIDEKRSISSVIYWIDEKRNINSVIYWIDEKKKHQFSDILNWREKNIDIDDINEKRTSTLNKMIIIHRLKLEILILIIWMTSKKKHIIFRRM
jgi:hypothetical protein